MVRSHENDDPRVRGGLDHTANDKTEGYEVLYFVNACARDWGWSNPSTTDYQKIERMLRIVPGHLRQQAEKKPGLRQTGALPLIDILVPLPLSQRTSSAGDERF
jgi:hypothetical protein